MGPKVVALVLLACLFSHEASANKIKGMAFGTGHDVWSIRQPFALKSLKILKSTGINYVHISSYVKMDSVKGWYLRPETDDNSIRYQIRMMKKQGLKVFFKPVVEIDNEQWRGFIPGRNAWLYKVYAPFIVRMARLAREEHVDLFAVGSEYVATLKNEKAWRDIIKMVRKVYWRKITYVANHDSYFNCKWWDAVDVISISAYFIFLDFHTGKTYGYSPNMWQTKRMWNKKAREINLWRRRRGWGAKKVLIAEVGAQSKGGGVVYRKPFLWTAKAPTNNWEQVKMYEGILGAFMPKRWCAGVILWNWEIRPYSNRWEPFKSGYTPQNKPAMKRMGKYFWRKY